MSPVKRKWLEFAVAFLSIAFIVSYFSRHFDEFHKIVHISAAHIIGILVLSFVIHLLIGYKVLLILKQLGLRTIPYLEWLKMFTVSRFINFHVTQGANVYRSILLKKDYDFSYTKSISVMLIFAWIDIIFIFFLAWSALVFTGSHWEISGLDLVFLLPMAALALIAVPMAIYAIFKRLDVRTPRLRWLHDKCLEMAIYTKRSVRDHVLLKRFFLLSAASFVLYVLAVYIAFAAIGVHLNAEASLVFTVAILLNSVVNITPNNIGVMELLYGGLANAMGLTLGEGVLACGIIRVLGYFLITGLALLCLGKKDKK